MELLTKKKVKRAGEGSERLGEKRASVEGNPSPRRNHLGSVFPQGKVEVGNESRGKKRGQDNWKK